MKHAWIAFAMATTVVGSTTALAQQSFYTLEPNRELVRIGPPAIVLAPTPRYVPRVYVPVEPIVEEPVAPIHHARPHRKRRVHKPHCPCLCKPPAAAEAAPLTTNNPAANASTPPPSVDKPPHGTSTPITHPNSPMPAAKTSAPTILPSGPTSLPNAATIAPPALPKASEPSAAPSTDHGLPIPSPLATPVPASSPTPLPVPSTLPQAVPQAAPMPNGFALPTPH